MNKIEKIMQLLEKRGFPKADQLSALKIMKMCGQFESMGVAQDNALRSLLAMFSKDAKHRQKQIDIFRQSTISGSVKSDLFDIKGRIQTWERDLVRFGFKREDFLNLILKSPALLFVSTGKFEENIVKIDEEYGKLGMTGSDFLKMCKKTPCLACYDFDTLTGKVDALYEHFSPHGVTMHDLVRAFRRQETLFTLTTEQVLSKARILLRHHAQGLWHIHSKDKSNTRETLSEALRFIVRSRPSGLALAERNIKSRRLLKMAQPDEKLGLGTYLSKKEYFQGIVEGFLHDKGRHSLVDALYRQKYFDEKFRAK